MRLVTFLIFFIVFAAAAYAAFSVITFEPDPIAPLVFVEPDIEQLKTLGIFPGVPKSDTVLNQAQEVRADQAVEKIAAAMATYQNLSSKAKEPLKTTIEILNGAMSSGKLPAYFLSNRDAANPKREYQTLGINLSSMVSVQPPQTYATCASGAGGPTNILVGDENANSLTCPLAGAISGDQIFLGGPGNDTITDASGNRIVNSGSGNDTIKLGPGRSIIVLEEGWGTDTLTVDCSGAKVEANEIPADFPVPWVSKFSNFIVLSPHIAIQNVIWQGNTLTNISTGDQLTVNENCFTLVSANQ